MSCEIRGLQETELAAHAKLVYESYREYVSDDSNPLANPHWWLEVVEHDPYYFPEQSRVMVLDGALVASVTCYWREMYCAGRVATVGAIGSVATHPDHRRQGYVREVLTEARQWMHDNQFDCSFLFGKEEVYGGSGWRLLSSLETTAVLRPPAGDLGLTVRPADFEVDVPALAAIYHEFNATLTGPFLRPEEYWERRVAGGYFHDRRPEFHLIAEGSQPVAYFRSGGAGQVAELGWLRSDPALPSRVIGTILQQWPQVTETRFSFCTRELLAAVAPLIWAPTAAALGEKRGLLRLEECYKGLWTYIGTGEGQFPEVVDTTSLLAFLRENEHVFWGGVDSF